MVGSANLNIMIKAARRAGRGLVKDFREVENLQVSMKGAGDFVSRADIQAEKTLKAELMGARPTYGWLAEEGGEEEGQDPTRRACGVLREEGTGETRGGPCCARNTSLA